MIKLVRRLLRPQLEHPVLEHVRWGKRDAFEEHIANAASAARGGKHEAHTLPDGTHVSYFGDPGHADIFKESLTNAEKLIKGNWKTSRIAITETAPRALDEKDVTAEHRELMKRGFYYIVEVKHSKPKVSKDKKEVDKVSLLLNYLTTQLRERGIEVNDKSCS